MGLQTLAGATFATTLLGAGTVVSANVLTVQQGDTLSEIAQKHHTTVAKLAKDNHIKDVNFITTGQKLSVDDKTAHTVTRKATDTDTHYTVVSGDTLSTIAEAYDTTANKIADLNQMSTTDTLQIGQVLTVAGDVAPTVTSAVAEPESTATSDVTEPESVASSAVAEPESTATSDVTNSESVPSSAVSEPVSVASSAVSEPESTVTSSVAELETTPIASSAVSEPESIASSSVVTSAELVSVATSDVAEPESTATSSVVTSAEPELVASSAVAEPESTATSSVATTAEPETVASSAVAEPDTTATSSIATPTAPEQTVAPTVDTPIANTTAGSLGAGSLTSAQRTAIVNEAVSLSQQNIPYVWGGKTTAGFDCSGLASYVFAQAGLSLPSYTVSEEAYVNTLDVSSPSDVTANAQPGDLLFWGEHGSTWHVAIYIGGGQYVAAPQPGMNVEVENVSTYFMPSFIGRY